MNLSEAIQYAAALHAGQFDKAGAPYLDHCLRVVALLPDSASNDERIAAVLHDTMEDCGLTADALIAAGAPLASVCIIEALSRRPGEPYRAFIERIAASGEAAIRVKLADIADNADPHRLARLDPTTAQRLAAKYAGARAVLDATR